MGVGAIPGSPGAGGFAGIMGVESRDKKPLEIDYVQCERCPGRKICEDIGNFRKSIPMNNSKNSDKVFRPDDWNKCAVATNILLSKFLTGALKSSDKHSKGVQGDPDNDKKIQDLERKIRFLNQLLNEEK
jgi:hypothetical protein